MGTIHTSILWEAILVRRVVSFSRGVGSGMEEVGVGVDVDVGVLVVVSSVLLVDILSDLLLLLVLILFGFRLEVDFKVGEEYLLFSGSANGDNDPMPLEVDDVLVVVLVEEEEEKVGLDPKTKDTHE